MNPVGNGGVWHLLRSVDWLLFGAALMLCAAGLVTMNSFQAENYFFERQIIWITLGVAIFFILSTFDFRFLRRTQVIFGLFVFSIVVLVLMFVLGNVVRGAQSWFDVGLFAIQPSDPIKLVVILLLAKYFSRRHIEIAHIRHLLISGVYVGSIVLLVLLQPDFGSAIIIAMLWAGMVVVVGISRKHLLALIGLALITVVGLWLFVFEDYQKQRVLTFLDPLTDLQGAGYNAYQSTVAVGSGQLVGKGIGFGTQSHLQFLPEYETDFIFAAFAEEWGFIGVVFLFTLFAIVLWRIMRIATYGASNFEMLFGLGLAILFMSHIFVHAGMNIGLLPITGTTIPFMSYGGSHLITEFAGLGLLIGMSNYRRTIQRETLANEIIGVSSEE